MTDEEKQNFRKQFQFDINGISGTKNDISFESCMKLEMDIEEAKILKTKIARNKKSFTERINNQLQKSYIYKIFFFNTNPKSLLNSPIHRNGYFSNIDIFHLNTTSDLELYFAILKQTRDTLVNKYNSEFVVILWDYDMHAEFLDKYDEPIKKFLRQENIRFYTLSEIIPDYKQDFERIKMVILNT